MVKKYELVKFKMGWDRFGNCVCYRIFMVKIWDDLSYLFKFYMLDIVFIFRSYFFKIVLVIVELLFVNISYVELYFKVVSL